MLTWYDLHVLRTWKKPLIHLFWLAFSEIGQSALLAEYVYKYKEFDSSFKWLWMYLHTIQVSSFNGKTAKIHDAYPLCCEG